ncbi:ATP-dependent DNA helicase pif1-like [Pyrus x bretschneideri]|uniref:ATP-dependent DNA helicase pif1-like n=1 Tax=Pyrus x bretschneideri TaxID=225117 RepID=UPI002030B6FD|nr:ATP-dependent DNA helicase pif1-like [Pyrus x bretschneideri]XP_048436632.1 ATP-dependent DNA helicase pif1-like [Pyrus x bretschneideri]XP_048436633.1 ATP-dependent DNA helicase pif1-like [Pyrus x bretschneideri]XP_048436634.1 ATP-dependent DNA helicase pif1-like [Pyrus x bretschneideri]XP_048436635.1 ATP-dependent DNA helicase pif1-like [Pyrus x bretschneideri]XP_048436636.1 ATP-dependent DNA helicase pif1-like [Pyrus x bretschneideri]XP_048436637.1 ATP-dependent DNA helicase pif1-like [
MNHKHCFEALDKSLSDILLHLHNSENKIPFGGKPILLGGDFRQILPVIPGGTKEDIVNASLNTSYLWSHFKNFQLKENMRLSRSGIRAEEKQNISDFADWILQIGDGKISDITDENNLNDKDTSLIKIPTDLIVHASANPISSIFLVTYPNFETSFTNFDYLRECTIITPRNTTVTDINNYIIELLPREQHVFLSYDSLCSSNGNVENLEASYPVEFLNKLDFNGLPAHNLTLKIGMPIMLLQNLNQTFGLCNGIRLVITQLFNKIIEAKILTRNNVGYKVFIPRITFAATENKWPFVFKRRQFPIRPCFAMTINKSQGQSLRQVGLYFSEPVFTHGQLYVALSRVTSKEDLKILISHGENDVKNYTANIVFKDVLQNLQSNC